MTTYIGWLLRTNRRLGPNPSLRSGQEFARAFRRDGERPLAPSQITRWEKGALPVGRPTIRRYEQLLGLPTESLVTISDAALRTIPGPGRRSAPVDQPTVVAPPTEELHDLLDRAADPGGAMTGVSWGKLTDLIGAQPALVLHPPKLWQDIAEQLLMELTIAQNTAWLQRNEAVSRLLEHPVAGPFLVAACIALAEDPSSPVVIEPLALLSVTAHPDANRYVLSQLERPATERACYGALLAAVHKIRHGHFQTELARVVACIGRLLADPGLTQVLRPLVTEVASAVVRHAPGAAARLRPPGARACRASENPDANLGQGPGPRIAAAAQRCGPDNGTDVDDVLTDLVRMVVGGTDPDQRMIATMLIASTPYRQAVAQALLGEITASIARRADDGHEISLRALTNLRVDMHRPLLYRILSGPAFPAQLRYNAAWAIPHCTGTFAAEQWHTILACQRAAWRSSPSGPGEGILHGLTYGLGTEGHRGVLVHIRDDPSMPSSSRMTALWLLNTVPPAQ
ncbi:hypothetical protein KRM28CT15_26430 [Krasilnikovia sp. M28-CT-15]